ncbi:MAG: DUF2905 domain-containing protein [Betaproteobacteria bacterium]|nr:MAG: DUF2905 domain-containing protein [Betaproteobacteria bacterium]
MSKWLIIVGLIFVAAGLLWPLMSKLGLGRLPGDIAVRRDGLSLYFPLMTCLVISVIVSIVIWIFRR